RAAFPVESVRYTWVPREQNKEADRLVNSALDGTPVRRDGTAGAASDGPTDAEPERAPNALVGWSATHPVVTTTLLLRHGETVHTAHKRFSGWGGDDPGLSDIGREQVRLTAEHLATRADVDVVVTSPMARARETADMVAGRLDVEVVVEHDLRECAFGEWDGLTFAQVQESAPDELSAWLESTAVRPPNGESFDDVSRRVSAARDRLLTEHANRTMLLVTHVTPLKTLVRLALDAPPHALFRMEVRPASLSDVQWFGDGHASVRTFNQTSHLR
ncbi:MAG TPA: histidine phosphatase family protein, partial [Actinomycetes bacterium]|nr:histidine phosphatase family protein [Actinomycetes bacterium]